MNKIADMLGMYLAAILLTLLAATLFSLAISVIPSICFNIITILKVWAGIWGIMFIKGSLKNKVF